MNAAQQAKDTLQEHMPKSIALGAAYQMSRFSDKVIEVRRVTFNNGYIYCERGATSEGDLAVAFKSGRVVS